MNYNKIFKFHIFSIIFTIILGTLLHFTYTWYNNNLFIAIFSATNESTWEHLKLIFYPMLFTIIIGYFYLDNNDNVKYICAKTIGIIVSMLFITIFFYTYTGILGTNYAILNIANFILSVLIGEYITYLLMNYNFTCNYMKSILILFIILLAFVYFTFSPPRINFFKDPINNSYGIK